MPYRVTASIRPHKLEDVVEALHDVGLHEFTAWETRGFTLHPRRSMYRGVAYFALDDKVLIEVVAPDDVASLVGDLIAANARTGNAGDGTVWVESIDRSIDVRTGSHDISAK